MPAQTHSCSCWSVIAQVRVINCWPRIGYSPHGVSPNVLLIHSSFSPSYRSRDQLCECELVQQGCSDVLMKKNMSMHISRILRYLMVGLMHIRWV